MVLTSQKQKLHTLRFSQLFYCQYLLTIIYLCGTQNVTLVSIFFITFIHKVHVLRWVYVETVTGVKLPSNASTPLGFPVSDHLAYLSQVYQFPLIEQSLKISPKASRM